MLAFSNLVETDYYVAGTESYSCENPNVELVGTTFNLRTELMAPYDLGTETITDVKAKAADLRIASEYTSSTIIPCYTMGGLENGALTYDDFQQVAVTSLAVRMNALGDEQVRLALVSLDSDARQHFRTVVACTASLWTTPKTA